MHSQPHRSCIALLLASLCLVGSGCRTFNTTDEEFLQQQRGIYSESPAAEAAWWSTGLPLQILCNGPAGR